ncbi:MAG TPA: hypothetical protein VM911_13885 [Pyrinomonadaceae bacterium]|jgi:hypothetical protein|nr:hypothetical protein [Pyrinomonadaceae bacterium]
MESEKQATVSDVQKNIPVASEDVFNYANVSHKKGDVRMITTTTDKIEALSSASGSLSSNFFALMVGVALSIFIALKSGGIEESWKRTFWVAFFFSLVLVLFFGIGTIQSELKKRRLRHELLQVIPSDNPTQ